MEEEELHRDYREVGINIELHIKVNVVFKVVRTTKTALGTCTR